MYNNFLQIINDCEKVSSSLVPSETITPKWFIEFQKIIYFQVYDIQREVIHVKVNTLTTSLVHTINV